MSVVDLLRNKRRSAVPEILDLIRLLITIESSHYMQIRVVHIPGAANTVADAISRLRVEDGRALTPLAAAPLPLPACILAYEQKLHQQLLRSTRPRR